MALDDITWSKTAVRKPLTKSIEQLNRFIAQYENWIIEGCYGDLIEAALPHCTELIYLNPTVEVCIAHCKARPWEPDKYPDASTQQAMLEMLVEWVRQYPHREDEFGLKRHRAIYDGFAGMKRELHKPEQFYAL